MSKVRVLALLALMLSAGCNFTPLPTERVKAEFQRKHPEYKIEHVAQDGNAQWGEYFIVDFSKPDDARRFYVFCKWEGRELSEIGDAHVAPTPAADAAK